MFCMAALPAVESMLLAAHKTMAAMRIPPMMNANFLGFTVPPYLFVFSAEGRKNATSDF